jgi:tRNA dimethylallyltransferase
MLYYRALAHGIDDLPAADANIRAELEAQAARSGWPALHAQLAAVDSVTAARLAPNDAQRIQRALEIYLVSGQPMSALLASAAASREASLYRFVPIALEPSDRAVLHERIARRFDAMLAAGFIDEVAALRARGNLDPSMPSMRCVGYRQAWEYLDGAIDSAAMRDKGIFATRQLCKRQLTWLRGMTERIVVDCCADSATRDAVEAIERALDEC